MSELDQLLRQAIASHQRGQGADAERLYALILKDHPACFDAQYMLGMMRGQQGRYRDALELVSAALRTRPDSADAWSTHGLILYKGARADDALASFARALELKPEHVGALNNRGNALCALKRHEEALASYDAALRIRPDFADALNNRGNLLRELDRNEEAVASYDRVIAVRPGFPEAHFNRGNALASLSRYEEAVASYRAALALNPRNAAVHLNLGNALKVLDELDSAAGHFRRVVEIEPGFAGAHNNLASTLLEQGAAEEAVLHYRRAVALQPDFAEALNGLGFALMMQGRMGPALDAVTRALAVKETPDGKSLFVNCVKDIEPAGDVRELKRLVERALAECWTRPATLAAVGARLVQCEGAVGAAIARTAQAWPRHLPRAELLGEASLAAVAGDTLLRRLLVVAPVLDVGLERFLTSLRSVLLAMAVDDAPAGATAADADVLALACGLAQQCFINDYAFAVDDEEDATVRVLLDALVGAIERAEEIPPLRLAAVAAHVPLHGVPGAERLLACDWPPSIVDLLRQQVAELGEEEVLRLAIPQLTPIDDRVSAAVRQQYEENPYPRWISVPRGEISTVAGDLRQRFASGSLDDPEPGRAPEILIAGCGTGQHSIQTALRYPDARVLAVDLSLRSLSYAKRKSRELGLTNVDYAQADILNLDALDRTFDLIESSGVLHHLADPLRGWRALLPRLRSGGVMKIGLYSELARRDVVAARAFIAERGYQPIADHIRRFRQELMALPPGAPLARLLTIGDFFNTSGCRDLLFHVQECRFTLPQIAAFIRESDLEFLGFELDAPIQHRYRSRFPADRAMNDLALWHAYETGNPSTFLGMYQFWVRRAR